MGDSHNREDRIIKPDFSVASQDKPGDRRKQVQKIINSVLAVDWDEKQEKINAGMYQDEEEQEYVQELISLAEKIIKVNRWTRGIENEYEDLEDYETVRAKKSCSEREQEYLEVRSQLMQEELDAIKEYYELMADFIQIQQQKLPEL